MSIYPKVETKISYSTMGKGKSSTEKCRLAGDILVPWRVCQCINMYQSCHQTYHQPSNPSSRACVGTPVDTSCRSKCRRLRMPISANSTKTFESLCFPDVHMEKNVKNPCLVDACHSFGKAWNEPWGNPNSIFR